MSIREALVWGAKKLKEKIGGNDSSIFDAEILLRAAVKKPKEFLYAYPKKNLSAAEEKKYKNFISRRAKREPVAYILGKKEFYGFEFLVSSAVLIPRPETEALISAVLSTIGSLAPYSTPRVIDIGTGSGAIAVTLQKLLPQARVFASDASSAALSLARKNAQRLGAKIIFKKGNLLEPFSKCSPSTSSGTNLFFCPSGAKRSRGHSLIIIANLPYLSRVEWQLVQPEVKKYEPKDALIGGKTGTEIYEKLFRGLSYLVCHSCDSSREASTEWESRNPKIQRIPHQVRDDTIIHLFIEIGYNQKTPIIKLLNKILRPQKIETFKDLNKKWRTIHAILTK